LVNNVLEYDVDLELRNEEGDTGLLVALKVPKPNRAIVEGLLRAGVDVKARDSQSKTGVMVLCERGDYPGLVELLLSAGVDPLVRYRDGATSLGKAGVNGYRKSAALLQKFEKCLTELESQPRPSLVEVVRREHWILAKLLIRKERDVDTKDGSGVTALGLAVERRNRPMVAALLAAGANPSQKSTDGHSLVAVAMSQGDVAIASQLLWAAEEPLDDERLRHLMEVCPKNQRNRVWNRLVALRTQMERRRPRRAFPLGKGSERL
jgi:ankyrin repeat protein